MAVHILNAEEAKGFRDAVNNDAEFRLAGKFFTNDVLFVFGDKKAIIKIREGVITEILLNPTFMDSSHFSIEASSDSWEKFLKPAPPPLYQALFPGMIRQIFHVGGDLEKAFAHFWAVTRMMSIMREMQNR